MPSFKCTKCGISIEFESKVYRTNETETIICSECGAEYHIKSSPVPSFKEKAKAFGLGLGKFAFEVAKVGISTLTNMQQKHDIAQNKLYDEGFDEWDEEKLKRRMGYANFWEESIIRQRLSEIREEQNNDDE